MEKKYTYQLQSSSLIKIWFLALFYPTQVVLGFIIITEIFRAFQGAWIIESLVVIIKVLVFSILQLVFTYPLFNSEKPAIASSKGIKVCFFFYFSYWKFINWYQIKQIHEGFLPLLNYRECVFVETNKAPALTRILGLMVIKEFKPGFILTCKIREYSELINKIESHLDN